MISHFKTRERDFQDIGTADIDSVLDEEEEEAEEDSEEEEEEEAATEEEATEDESVSLEIEKIYVEPCEMLVFEVELPEDFANDWFVDTDVGLFRSAFVDARNINSDSDSDSDEPLYAGAFSVFVPCSAKPGQWYDFDAVSESSDEEEEEASTAAEEEEEEQATESEEEPNNLTIYWQFESGDWVKQKKYLITVFDPEASGSGGGFMSNIIWLVVFAVIGYAAYTFLM